MLVILEGLDKTGKSTVAEHFRQKKRFEYVHMTAPAKWHTRDTYFAEMLHTLALTAGKNVVMDRSWMGELVWPHIFGRNNLLCDKDCDRLLMVAEALHEGNLRCIYMHDPDHEAHMARIAKFKEPSYDFIQAKALYDLAMSNQGFEYVTFQEAEVNGWT